eukprot:9043271-Pyramimonas_sp.AAC.1
MAMQHFDVVFVDVALLVLDLWIQSPGATPSSTHPRHASRGPPVSRACLGHGLGVRCAAGREIGRRM